MQQCLARTLECGRSHDYVQPGIYIYIRHTQQWAKLWGYILRVINQESKANSGFIRENVEIYESENFVWIDTKQYKGLKENPLYEVSNLQVQASPSDLTDQYVQQQLENIYKLFHPTSLCRDHTWVRSNVFIHKFIYLFI